MQIFRHHFQQGLSSFRNALLLLCAAGLLPASALGAPIEEISRAVAVNGIADVSTAQPKQFLQPFTAVALRVNPRQLPDYVIAAINLRPDLAANIAAIAIKAATRNLKEKPKALCAMIDRITGAAIAANPDAVVLIVKAGASASPELRQCVINGAVSAAPRAKDVILQAAMAKTVPFAFLTFSATPASGFSFGAATLNPANVSDLASDNVNSPEQPPTP